MDIDDSITFTELRELERMAFTESKSWAPILGAAMSYIEDLLGELHDARRYIRHLESITPDMDLIKQQDEILKRVSNCNAMAQDMIRIAKNGRRKGDGNV